MYVHFLSAFDPPDHQRFALLRCLFGSPSPLSSANFCPERTAKPTVKYFDQLTTSPDPSNDTFQLQTSRSQHTDNEDNDDGHHSPSHTVPPRSFSDIPRPGRRTSAQSVRRRMTYGGRATSVPGSVSTQDPGASALTMVERAKSSLSNLLVPEHKVGEAPGFLRELRTIMFGSCASCCLIFLQTHITF